MRGIVRYSLVLWLIACGAASNPGTRGAVAHPTVPENPASPFYWHADGGFGTPEGLVGAGVGVRPTHWSSFEVGGGLSDSGPAAACMAGVQVRVSDSSELGGSAGVSFGRNTDVDEDSLFDESSGPQAKTTWRWVLWGNAEVTARRVLDTQSAIRLHIGIAAPIKSATPVCESGRPDSGECSVSKLDNVLPYIGMGYERRF